MVTDQVPPLAAEGLRRGRISFVLVLLDSYQNIPSAEQSSHGMREDRGGEAVLTASASHHLLCLAEIAGLREVSGKRLAELARGDS